LQQIGFDVEWLGCLDVDGLGGVPSALLEGGRRRDHCLDCAVHGVELEDAPARDGIVTVNIVESHVELTERRELSARARLDENHLELSGVLKRRTRGAVR
jgi:hypothetical protein